MDNQKTLGTLAVFATAICTILGAILFLRFGWAIANVGFYGVMGIILISHLITIPASLAIAEISTNQKVLGGGAYYIISRSFGLNIGGAIGITLYISQAISVAFYIIAFAEAFQPIIEQLTPIIGFALDKRVISLTMMTILAAVVLKKGLGMGMKSMYVVAVLLAISILMFLFGQPLIAESQVNLNAHITEPNGFFYVFAVIFPAFTGVAAGLGLSGDLKDPNKSIPRGTLLATFVGLVVYILISFKLSYSASPDQLIADDLIMSKIAIWGPIIPIGLAAATLSSAIGSIIVAPRTLQALGVDEILPGKKLNSWLSNETNKKEPKNASVISILISYFFIAIGDVNFVAEIISMFFIITYGTICLISFFEYFASSPAYRPTFKSNTWYMSLMGAVLSFWAMFKMNTGYAVLSIVIMSLVLFLINYYNPSRKGFSNLLKGVIFQLTRKMQLQAQRVYKEDSDQTWRPFIICISEDTFKRKSAFDLLCWISYKFGFGTYIHFLKGFLTKETYDESKKVREKLIKDSKINEDNVYIDTIISPSYTSAIAQTLQLSSVSGTEHNMIMFELLRDKPNFLKEIANNYDIFKTTNTDLCILSTSIKGFGYKRSIHVWIRLDDYKTTNLQILLAYIMMGHPDWRKGEIKVFSMIDDHHVEEKKKQEFYNRVHKNRIPIAFNNIKFITVNGETHREIISKNSNDADLVILSFSDKYMKSTPEKMFEGYVDLPNILFVNSNYTKEY